MYRNIHLAISQSILFSVVASHKYCANCDINLSFGTLVHFDMMNIFRYPATLLVPSGGSGATYKNQPFFNVHISVYQTILATFQHFYILIARRTLHAMINT